METETKGIIWLGDLGFPIGLANIQKCLLVCKSLEKCGVKTTVISRFGIHDRKQHPGIKSEANYQGVNYIYASGTVYRPSNFMNRNYHKIKGLIKEIALLHKMKQTGDVDAAILHTNKFTSILFYKILSILFGFPLVMLLSELYTTKVNVGKKYKIINNFLYEHIGLSILDGVMPISEIIIDLVSERAPNVPLLKVPVITDLERFGTKKVRNSEKDYFLFCGYSGYFEIIIFILKSFEMMKESDNTLLYLVLNGEKKHIGIILEEIDKISKKDFVKIFSEVSDTSLVELYSNAKALLIPLRPTLQDKARFPHKIGEYLASGRPVLTTNYGEVKEYLKDLETALIADDYTTKKFAEKMDYVLLHPQESEEIGQKGKDLCDKQFNYQKYGVQIKAFLNKIIKSPTPERPALVSPLKGDGIALPPEGDKRPAGSAL